MLLTTGNPKTEKGAEFGYFSAILHLAPSTLSGVDVCPYASKGCREFCLNTAGRGGIFKAGETSNAIQRARMRRTEFYLEKKATFLDELRGDIRAHAKLVKEGRFLLKVEFRPPAIRHSPLDSAQACAQCLAIPRRYRGTGAKDMRQIQVLIRKQQLGKRPVVETRQVNCHYINGALAVTSAVDVKGYKVTHIATGYSLSACDTVRSGKRSVDYILSKLTGLSFDNPKDFNGMPKAIIRAAQGIVQSCVWHASLDVGDIRGGSSRTIADVPTLDLAPYIAQARARRESRNAKRRIGKATLQTAPKEEEHCKLCGQLLLDVPLDGRRCWCGNTPVRDPRRHGEDCACTDCSRRSTMREVGRCY